MTEFKISSKMPYDFWNSVIGGDEIIYVFYLNFKFQKRENHKKL